MIGAILSVSADFSKAPCAERFGPLALDFSGIGHMCQAGLQCGIVLFIHQIQSVFLLPLVWILSDDPA